MHESLRPVPRDRKRESDSVERDRARDALLDADPAVRAVLGADHARDPVLEKEDVLGADLLADSRPLADRLIDDYTDCLLEGVLSAARSGGTSLTFDRHEANIGRRQRPASPSAPSGVALPPSHRGEDTPRPGAASDAALPPSYRCEDTDLGPARRSRYPLLSGASRNRRVAWTTVAVWV